MASVKVFGSPTSTEVARVLACLFEKEVDFQLIRVDGFRGRKRMPEYLKLQPSGQAVAFDDGICTMVDSRNICRYIAEEYPNKGTKDLLGKGTLERAAIEQWLLTEEQRFDPPSSALVFHLAYAPLAGLETDEDEVEEKKEILASVLDMYEQKLEESEYLAGNSFSLADLSHLPNACYLMKNPGCRNLFESRNRVKGWWERISSRESWKKVAKMQKVNLPLVEKPLPPPPML